MGLIKKLLVVCLLCLPMMMQADGVNYVGTSQVQDAFVLSAHDKSAKIRVASSLFRKVFDT